MDRGRRSFLGWLLVILGGGLLGCGPKKEEIWVPWPGSSSGSSGSQPQSISVLQDLRQKTGGVEVTYDYDDPFVIRLPGPGDRCFYFEVNGQRTVGPGIHVESVMISPGTDQVQWFCNGQPIYF